MKHIELFAGCGGLSLGLKALGYENILTNELSPMASETYAYNFFNESLASPEFLDIPSPHTVWLGSNYSKMNMSARLREDPRTYPKYDDDASFSDIINLKSLRHKLIIGNIKELNRLLKSKPLLLEGINDVEVVSGGPPCQSFSMAGLRELSNDRNTLPWEFMKFVDLTKPKIAVLENVSGILRAFKSEGKPYYAWFEIAKSFATLGYVPICLHVNARFSGVVQNRNRFILIAIRFDVFNQKFSLFNDDEIQLVNQSLIFYRAIENSQAVDTGDIKVINLTKDTDNSLLNTFLAPFLEYRNNSFSVKDVIDDLKTLNSDRNKKNDYIEFIERKLNSPEECNSNKVENHELRANSLIVKRRFRIYQVLSQLTSVEKREVTDLLKGKIHSLPGQLIKKLLEFEFFVMDGKFEKFTNEMALTEFLLQHSTKKHSQKALVAELPAPSALSIPDDVCHYDKNELRTLTVREMARIQSFPDSFVFKSKITTGGKMRRYEVPQYTQVGNAVPPLLGVAIGKVIKNILS